MIQRIQSVWFLLAAITVLCLLVVPVLSTTTNGITYTLFGSGIEMDGSEISDSKLNLPLLISTVLAALINIANIFNFRNRTLQKRIASLNILLILGLSFWLSQLGNKMPGGLATANVGVGLFLPSIAIIFNVLAIRGIKSDEKLLRSADRLR